jgi:hypothetical protein
MDLYVPLLGLEEEDCAVPEIKVDEVFGFVCDKRPEVSADNAVPRWALTLVKLEIVRI